MKDGRAGAASNEEADHCDSHRQGLGSRKPPRLIATRPATLSVALAEFTPVALHAALRDRHPYGAARLHRKRERLAFALPAVATLCTSPRLLAPTCTFMPKRHWTGCRNYVQCYADLQAQTQPNCA